MGQKPLKDCSKCSAGKRCTDFEQYEGEEMMTEFPFLSDLLF